MLLCVLPEPEGQREMRRLVVGALLMVAGFWPFAVEGHPGRLDKTGCHHVHKTFVYKSGKVAPRGEYHCHRLLGGERLVPAIILDGREILMDSKKDVEQDELEQDSKEQSP